MTRHISLTALILALAIPSCSTPRKKEPSSPVVVPQEWKAVGLKSPLAPSGWLSTFHDPMLDSVVRGVLTDNYDLKAAAARLQAAVANSRVASADL